MLITKRSGQTEEYDRKKIALAITKAFKSTGIEQPDDLDELLDLVEKQILVTPGCSVETIQDRVSVPMWGTFLSEPLSIEGLVSRYLTNCLMERIPIDNRNSLITRPCGLIMPSGINPTFAGLSPSDR